MSYYDDPGIDDNAKRSQESVHLVTGLFSLKNGFIARTETPDYGVDVDVELIIDGTGASSKKFPVQIKSAVNLKTVKIKEKEYISYPFKTSRLGYLAKRIPAYGIIALYDDTEETCYFDYVDEIINRLNNDEDREGWQEQEQVNILLPIQKLDKAVLPSLHQKFVARYESHSLLIQEYGPLYDIPSLDPASPGEKKMNFNDPEQVAAFLEKYGSLLHNEGKFPIVNQLLGIVSRQRLNNSPQLVFLAALTYTHTGNIIEAEYFLRKARKIPELMDGEGPDMLEFSEMRVQYLKGNIDYEFFHARFKLMAERTVTIENKLSLTINLLYLELAKEMETGNLAGDYEARVKALFEEINNAPISLYQKHLLKCNHAESMFEYAHRSQMNLYAQVKIKDDLRRPMPMAEREKLGLQYHNGIQLANQEIYNAYLYGRNENIPLLKATAAHLMGRIFLCQHLGLLHLRESDRPKQDKAYLIELYDRNQNFCIISYAEYLELRKFHEAYEALINAYEINQLCIYLTGTSIGPQPQEELLRIITEIGETFEYVPFQSSVIEVTQQLDAEKNNDGKYFKNRTDEEIERMAKIILKEYKLPTDRLPNIIHDMQMKRTFEQEVTNPEIFLLQDGRHTQSPLTHYASLPLYALSHRSLGITSKTSSDIRWLLNEFASILKKGN